MQLFIGHLAEKSLSFSIRGALSSFSLIMSSPREIPSLHSIDSKPINQSLESPSQSSELVSQFQVSDPFSRGSLAQRNVVCYEVQNMDQRFPLSTWEKSSCATDVMATDVMAMMCYPLIRRVSSIEATEHL